MGAYLTELQKQCLFDKEDLKVIFRDDRDG
jgi:hypothetical protein